MSFSIGDIIMAKVKSNTLFVYKGRNKVLINREDLGNWEDDGWRTSSNRQKKDSKDSKETEKTEESEK